MCLRAQAGWLLRPPTASMPACRPSQRPQAGTSLNRKSPRPRGPSGASAQTSSSSDQCRGQAVLPTTSSAGERTPRRVTRQGCLQLQVPTMEGSTREGATTERDKAGIRRGRTDCRSPRLFSASCARTLRSCAGTPLNGFTWCSTAANSKIALISFARFARSTRWHRRTPLQPHAQLLPA